MGIGKIQYRKTYNFTHRTYYSTPKKLITSHFCYFRATPPPRHPTPALLAFAFVVRPPPPCRSIVRRLLASRCRPPPPGATTSPPTSSLRPPPHIALSRRWLLNRHCCFRRSRHILFRWLVNKYDPATVFRVVFGYN